MTSVLFSTSKVTHTFTKLLYNLINNDHRKLKLTKNNITNCKYN